MVFVPLLILAALLVAGCGPEADSPRTADRFDEERAFEHLEAQVEIGPRPSGTPENRTLVRYLARELEVAGAADVSVQRPWANVVGTIPGAQEGTIVIGAHHDTKDVPGLVGANDGASGVAVVLELARVLASGAPLAGPSVSIALFDAEEARGDRAFAEDGLRGSRQYVAYAESERQNSSRLEAIESMVLFDMVGDCDLQIPRESNSNAEIYALFAEAAADLDESDSPAPFEGETSAIADDHVPFLEAGIPAVDLIDFTYGSGETPGPFWHTTEDTLDKVCAESLDAVGEPAVVVLAGPETE